MKIILLCLLLGGCAGLPTLEYCEHIKYERSGAKATLVAECTLPVGGLIRIP